MTLIIETSILVIDNAHQVIDGSLLVMGVPFRMLLIDCMTCTKDSLRRLSDAVSPQTNLILVTTVVHLTLNLIWIRRLILVLPHNLILERLLQLRIFLI